MNGLLVLGAHMRSTPLPAPILSKNVVVLAEEAEAVVHIVVVIVVFHMVASGVINSLVQISVPVPVILVIVGPALVLHIVSSADNKNQKEKTRCL